MTDIVETLRDGCDCGFAKDDCPAKEACHDAFAAADEIERLREALRGMDKATISHVDGRDLLDELQPNDHIDIKVRIDGGYDVYEGDWLNRLRDARNEARTALEQAQPVAAREKE